MALLLILVGAGAAYELRKEDTSAPPRTTLRSCPTPGPAASTPAAGRPVALPRPQQVALALLNGTSRNGLAKTVGDQLAALGFRVTGQGNAPAALAGASTVSYGPRALASGTLVSHWVLGSRLVAAPAAPAGSVQVVLGSSFQRLATPAEAAAASDNAPAASTPAASGAPATTTAGCPA
jgi:hypothetical protein